MTRAELRRQWNAAIHRGRPERKAQQRDAKDERRPISAATKKSFRRWEKYTGKPIVYGALFVGSPALALEPKEEHNDPAVELRGGAEEKPG